MVPIFDDPGAVRRWLTERAKRPDAVGAFAADLLETAGYPLEDGIAAAYAVVQARHSAGVERRFLTEYGAFSDRQASRRRQPYRPLAEALEGWR